MDAVIAYVNGNDPIWLAQYEKYVGGTPDITSYRDCGTLKYIFRGIDKFMPFVDRIILVVSGESQVPNFVNRDTVKIVKHEEFIPPEFLPTFNSNTIEAFMPKIDSLSEEFLYFNDDFFVLQPCVEEDFFVDGKPCITFRNDDDFSHGFFLICKNSTNIANYIAFGRKARFIGVLMPEHTIAPMTRSKCLECLENGHNLIVQTLSTVRDTKNVAQYIYTNYMYLIGYFIDKPITYALLRLHSNEINNIVLEISESRHKTLCINERRSFNETPATDNDIARIISAFDEKFPELSRFETAP